MKFSPFIYDYIISDDWEFLDNMTSYQDSKEYFGFDVPFTEEDLCNDNWDKFREYLEKWIQEHQLDVVDSEVVWYDLEKGYEDIDVIFSFEGKYYKTSYSTGWSWGPYRYGYPEDSKEVFPHTKTIEVTKYY